MTDIAVTLGRNEFGVPMNGLDWKLFKDSVCQRITDSDGTVWACNEGTGQWNGETETNCVITASVPAPYLSSLRASIKGIGQAFHQEAVAFLVGTTELL